MGPKLAEAILDYQNRRPIHVAQRGTKWHRSTRQGFLAAPSTSRSIFLADEIVSLSGPVNTLLKSSYLLGPSFEIEATINSLFDIAKEIAGVETCGLLSCMENDPASWEVRLGRHIESHSFPGKPLLPDRPRGDRRSFRESRFHGPRMGSLVRPDLRGVVLPFPGRVSPAQRSRHHERRRLRQTGFASLHPRADETPLGPRTPGRNPPASHRFREHRLRLLVPRPVDPPLQSPILRPSARKRDPPLPAATADRSAC